MSMLPSAIEVNGKEIKDLDLESVSVQMGSDMK